MRVLVCVKRVPAPGARINLTPTSSPSTRPTSGSRPARTRSARSRRRCSSSRPTAARRRCSRSARRRPRSSCATRSASAWPAPCCSRSTGADWDPQRTAEAITSAITALEGEDGPFDLLLFGNESADAGGFQVGVRVAHALGRPIVNGAKGLDVVDGRAVVRRETDAGVERYELPLPAAVGVKEGINLPRYPTMKGRLASKKATIRRIDVDAADGRAAPRAPRASRRAGVGHDDPRPRRRRCAGRRRPARPSSACVSR